MMMMMMMIIEYRFIRTSGSLFLGPVKTMQLDLLGLRDR